MQYLSLNDDHSDFVRLSINIVSSRTIEAVAIIGTLAALNGIKTEAKSFLLEKLNQLLRL